MTDYTPTTEDVRRVYRNSTLLPPEMRVAEFDRWIAAHDAEIREQTRDGDAAAMVEADLFRDASSWAWWLRARGDMKPHTTDEPSQFAGDIAEHIDVADMDRRGDERWENER